MDLTIMLVDDEPGIRKLIGLALSKRGYHVIEAANGIEALSEMDSSSGSVSLLITDIEMPQMDGITLSDKIRAKFPCVPVIYISGYCTRESIRERLQQRQTAFLQKPLLIPDLVNTIKALLAERIPIQAQYGIDLPRPKTA